MMIGSRRSHFSSGSSNCDRSRPTRFLVIRSRQTLLTRALYSIPGCPQVAGLSSTAFAPTREMPDVYTILLRSSRPEHLSDYLCMLPMSSNGCGLYHRIIRLQQNIQLPWPVYGPCRLEARVMELIYNTRIFIDRSGACVRPEMRFAFRVRQRAIESGLIA